MLTQLIQSFSLGTVMLIQAVAICMLVGERRRMKHYNMTTEAAFSRVTAWVYIVGSVVIWIGIQVAVKFIK